MKKIEFLLLIAYPTSSNSVDNAESDEILSLRFESFLFESVDVAVSEATINTNENGYAVAVFLIGLETSKLWIYYSKDVIVKFVKADSFVQVLDHLYKAIPAIDKKIVVDDIIDLRSITVRTVVKHMLNGIINCHSLRYCLGFF